MLVFCNREPGTGLCSARHECRAGRGKGHSAPPGGEGAGEGCSPPGSIAQPAGATKLLLLGGLLPPPLLALGGRGPGEELPLPLLLPSS